MSARVVSDSPTRGFVVNAHSWTSTNWVRAVLSGRRVPPMLVIGPRWSLQTAWSAQPSTRGRPGNSAPGSRFAPAAQIRGTRPGGGLASLRSWRRAGMFAESFPNSRRTARSPATPGPVSSNCPAWPAMPGLRRPCSGTQAGRGPVDRRASADGAGFDSTRAGTGRPTSRCRPWLGTSTTPRSRPKSGRPGSQRPAIVSRRDSFTSTQVRSFCQVSSTVPSYRLGSRPSQPDGAPSKRARRSLPDRPRWSTGHW